MLQLVSQARGSSAVRVFLFVAVRKLFTVGKNLSIFRNVIGNSIVFIASMHCINVCLKVLEVFYSLILFSLKI